MLNLKACVLIISPYRFEPRRPDKMLFGILNSGVDVDIDVFEIVRTFCQIELSLS